MDIIISAILIILTIIVLFVTTMNESKDKGENFFSMLCWFLFTMFFVYISGFRIVEKTFFGETNPLIANDELSLISASFNFDFLLVTFVALTSISFFATAISTSKNSIKYFFVSLLLILSTMAYTFNCGFQAAQKTFF
ncbi:MAG: hypothetical protein ABIH48_00940 [Candidatus Falkowbacteria bacterium]